MLVSPCSWTARRMKTYGLDCSDSLRERHPAVSLSALLSVTDAHVQHWCACTCSVLREIYSGFRKQAEKRIYPTLRSVKLGILPQLPTAL